MKKRIFFICSTIFFATSSYADTGLSAMSDAGDGVVTYLPFVRALCYVIAAVIAIVGAMSVYVSMQTAPQQTNKRIMMTVGSCLTFVFMATALPQFFGLDGSVTSVGGGSSTSLDGTSGSGNGFLASDQGGISQSGLKTEIPNFADRNWVHFPNGTKMETANFLLDIYDKNGGGSTGSYGKTLDYINKLYWNQEINTDTYNSLMSVAGNLPHN